MQPAFALLPLSISSTPDIIELIKAWFSILKFLKTKPPQSIKQNGDGQNIILQNCDGDIKIVNGNVYNTFIMSDIGKTTEPLQAPIRRGATGLEIRSKHNLVEKYTLEEIQNFVTIRPTSEILRSEVEVILGVVSPVFEGGGIWKFRYGSALINAKLNDEISLVE
jgi:hypothetical protein